MSKPKEIKKIESSLKKNRVENTSLLMSIFFSMRKVLDPIPAL